MYQRLQLHLKVDHVCVIILISEGSGFAWQAFIIYQSNK